MLLVLLEWAALIYGISIIISEDWILSQFSALAMVAGMSAAMILRGQRRAEIQVQC